MAATDGCDGSKSQNHGKERTVNLAKMTLEELLYYVLVELRVNGRGIVVA